MLNEARKIRGFCCDQCGKTLTAGHELVLADTKWKELVAKSKSPWEPKFTLLCPECIEELNGGPLALADLLHEWKMEGDRRLLGAVPMNLWYMREHGMMTEAKPYIKAMLERSRLARKVWEHAGLTTEEGMPSY